ncbi:hypothetical protein [Actinoplanes sp. NPDC026619]|uniref:tetratricopeptide repeat protein n=1 Tax=Actinoplanes sp. NPDC026619 TaxID=3155798 RepID=UPI0033DB8582
MLAPRRPQVAKRLRILAKLSSVGGFAVLAGFLAREGLDDADKWMSVIGGMAGVAGLLLAAATRERAPAGVASPRPPSHVAGLLLKLREDGTLPLVQDVTGPDLGVKAAISLDASTPNRLPQYVPRFGDGDLDWAIADGGMVLIHGRAASGKTRTAFEAVGRLRPGHQILIPAHPKALRELLEIGFEVRDCVIWLDDVERFLVPDGLDESLVALLCPPGRSDVTIVATIRDQELSRLNRLAASRQQRDDVDGSSVVKFADSGQRLIASVAGRRRIFIDQYLSHEIEQAAASQAGGDDARIAAALRSPFGFAEYLAAGPAMMTYWTTGDGPLYDVGQAVVNVAVDCRRAGFTKPVDEELLVALYRGYMSAARRNRADLPSFPDGVAWACEPVLGASSCLIPHAAGGYSASDYLLDRTQAGEGPLGGLAVPAEVWQAVIAVGDGHDADSIGVTAQESGLAGIAESAFRKGFDGGDAAAAYSLAAIFFRTERQDEAEPILRWLIHEVGEEGAAAGLGKILFGQGRVEEAEHYLRIAMDHGDAMGTIDFSRLLRGRDQVDEADRLLGSLALAGNTKAARELAATLAERGRSAEAEQFLRQVESSLLPSAEAGDRGAILELADLAAKHGKSGDIEHRLRPLADGGDNAAAARLGRHLSQCGRYSEAEPYLRRAADGGDPPSVLRLVAVLVRLERPDEGERYMRRVADGADGDYAAAALGRWLVRDRRDDEAEPYLRTAAAAGDAEASAELEALLARRVPEEPADR